VSGAEIAMCGSTCRPLVKCGRFITGRWNFKRGFQPVPTTESIGQIHGAVRNFEHKKKDSEVLSKSKESGAFISVRGMVGQIVSHTNQARRILSRPRLEQFMGLQGGETVGPTGSSICPEEKARIIEVQFAIPEKWD